MTVETQSLYILEFEIGAIGSVNISFDIWCSDTPRFEIFGTNGTICISDPDPVHGVNDFHGPVWYRTRRESRWEYQPRPTDRPADWLVAESRHGFNQNSRGLGFLRYAEHFGGAVERAALSISAADVNASYLCQKIFPRSQVWWTLRLRFKTDVHHGRAVLCQTIMSITRLESSEPFFTTLLIPGRGSSQCDMQMHCVELVRRANTN